MNTKFLLSLFIVFIINTCTADKKVTFEILRSNKCDHLVKFNQTLDFASVWTYYGSLTNGCEPFSFNKITKLMTLAHDKHESDRVIPRQYFLYLGNDEWVDAVAYQQDGSTAKKEVCFENDTIIHEGDGWCHFDERQCVVDDCNGECSGVREILIGSPNLTTPCYAHIETYTCACMAKQHTNNCTSISFRKYIDRTHKSRYIHSLELAQSKTLH